MSAAALIVGASLCWAMPQTTVTPPAALHVRVVELAVIPSNRQPGAWVEATDPGRLQGLQWHVAATELQECKKP